MHVLVCGLLLALLQALQPQQVDTAFLEGKEVQLRFAKPQKRERMYSLGPWRLGPRLQNPSAGKPEKPHDERLNIYIVVPGTQQQSAEQPEFDHNFILNAAPRKNREAEYDVFWAITLDPQMRADLQRENDLLLTAQQKFAPNDLFEFDDLAGASFMASALNVDSLKTMKKHRHKDGSFPRVLIIPAGFALRLAVGPLM
jgi:hypothetical protein